MYGLWVPGKINMQATTDDLFYSRIRKSNITQSWQDVEKSISCVVCDVLTDLGRHIGAALTTGYICCIIHVEET